MATEYIITYPPHEDWLACNYCQEYGTDGCEGCCVRVPIKEEKIMRTKFHSAEQSAMHDIYHEQSGIAKDIIASAELERGKGHSQSDDVEMKERYWAYTSMHYAQAYWYHNIYDVINDLFVGVESLATKSSRKLNRKLGLHKVNK